MKALAAHPDHLPLPQHMRTTAVVIPVYNHSMHIEAIIRKTQALGLPVFVVDDGSTDSTTDIIRNIAGINFQRHSVNLGKGAALLTGFAAAHAQGYDWAITLDGDGQHNPEDAGELLNVVNEGERCIVIGNRQGMTEDAHVPWTSRFGRKFSNFWVWIAGGPWTEDSQSGFRLYPLPETLNLGAEARRYQFEVEILVRAHQQGLITKKAPVRVTYWEKGVRVSHYRPWLDFMRNAETFNRLIWTRIFAKFRS